MLDMLVEIPGAWRYPMTVSYAPSESPLSAPAVSRRVETVRVGHAESLLHAGPQVPISITTIMHELRPWLKARYTNGVAVLASGADAWAATDFAAWLNNGAGSVPARYWDIERDAAIYRNPDQRVALLFNRRSAPTLHPLIAVGVRVQSLLVTPVRFAQGVQAELDRLEARSLREPFDAAERFVMVMTVDGAGAAALRPLGFEAKAALDTGQAVMWRAVRG